MEQKSNQFHLIMAQYIKSLCVFYSGRCSNDEEVIFACIKSLDSNQVFKSLFKSCVDVLLLDLEGLPLRVAMTYKEYVKSSKDSKSQPFNSNLSEFAARIEIQSFLRKELDNQLSSSIRTISKNSFVAGVCIGMLVAVTFSFFVDLSFSFPLHNSPKVENNSTL